MNLKDYLTEEQIKEQRAEWMSIFVQTNVSFEDFLTKTYNLK